MFWKSQVDALFESCKKGDLDIKSLKPADIASMRDATGQSLLDVAVLSKHRELIAALIVSVGTGVHGPESLQRALRCAAQTGDIKLFKEVHHQMLTLVRDTSTAVDSFMRGYREGAICDRALKDACVRGAADVVRVILDSEGRHFLDWPLLEAWVHGHLGIVDTLIEAGARRHEDPIFTTKVLKRSHSLLGNSMDGETRRALINHLAARGAGAPQIADHRVKDEFDEDEGLYWSTLGEYGTETLARHSVDSFDVQGDHGRKVTDVLFGASISNNVEVFKYILDVAQPLDSELRLDLLLDRSLASGSKDVAEHIVATFPAALSARTDRYFSYPPLDMKKKLVLAAGCGSVAVMKRIMDSTGIGINCAANSPWQTYANSSLCTALSLASDTDTIRFLLDAKADVNPEGCDTVLRGACEKLRPESVKMLLAAGAKVNRVSGRGGRSALDYAVYAKCPGDQVCHKVEIINMLLDAGASARNCDEGASVLHLPCLDDEQSYNLEAAFAAVLARDPGLVHWRDVHGATPLLSVVGRHSVSPTLVKVLIDAKADVNAVDAQDHPVCLLPFESQNYRTTWEDKANMRRCLQLLLDAGANPALYRGEGGETLLMQLIAVGSAQWHRLPELGFRGLPSVLGDVINAVAHNDGGQEVEVASKPGAGSYGDGGARRKTRVWDCTDTGTAAITGATEDEKQSGQPLQKSRRL